MLNSSAGIFLYLLMPNHWTWRLLSNGEKEEILRANASFNNVRDDYADPLKYSKGESFDLDTPRTQLPRGKELQSFLEKHQPKSITEIGPASGFYTKQIVEFPSVTKYYAVDINKGFLNFLSTRLEQVKAKRPAFEFETIAGDVNEVTLPNVDAVIAFSCVHHIPDRAMLFRNLAACLSPGGHLLCIDPSHYLQRILRLLRKCFRGPHLTSAYRENRSNLSTHHFCTLLEYKYVVKQVPQLEIAHAKFFLPNRVRKYLGPLLDPGIFGFLGWLRRWLSSEIIVEMKRQNG